MGIRYRNTETRIVAAKPESPATHAGLRFTPNNYNNVKMGSAATTEDHTKLPFSGV